MLYIIVGLVLFVIFAIVALVFFRHLQERGIIARSLNMSLFLVTLPRYPTEQKDEEHKEEKEKISYMEQFLSSFSNLQEHGFFKKLLFGAPYIVLEMAVHHKGEEIHTYIAVPKNLEAILEKQVHGFFPQAEVQKMEDYNIFNPHGSAAASYLELNRSSVLPLATYQTLSADPMVNITTAMRKIAEEGEGTALQLVLRPHNFKDQKRLAQKVISEMHKGFDFSSAYEKVSRSAKSELKGTIKAQTKEDELAPHGPIDENTIKALQGKLSKTHFFANMRLLASAENTTRAENILSELEAAFVQFNTSTWNSIKPKRVKQRNFKKFIFKYSFRLPDKKASFPFSVEELVSFYHFPTTAGAAMGMKSLKYKGAEPPFNLPKQGISLGENVYRGTHTVVRATREDRRRHFYTIGQTGTGKSVLLENMIKQDIDAGEGVALIDPHGDLAEKVLRLVPPERRNDVVWFNPGDVTRPFGLNMLEYDISRPEQKTLVVNELLAVFKKLFLAEHMGPVFDQYFRGAALLLLEDYKNEIPTMLDISKVLTNTAYRREKLDRIDNQQVRDFWREQAEKVGGEASLENMAPYITSKIDGFVADDFMRPIISQQKSSINFREAMDQKKIILVNLSKGRLGELNANLIGLLVVGKLLIASLSRADSAEGERNDFYLYIDEFQNFTTDSIASILSEARKYRLNLIISHQFIRQLEDNIRDAVFGNVGSMAAFRVGAEDAETLVEHFDPVFNQNDLINIDNFQAHVKLLIDGQTSTPFTMRTFPPKE